MYIYFTISLDIAEYFLVVLTFCYHNIVVLLLTTINVFVWLDVCVPICQYISLCAVCKVLLTLDLIMLEIFHYSFRCCNVLRSRHIHTQKNGTDRKKHIHGRIESKKVHNIFCSGVFIVRQLFCWLQTFGPILLLYTKHTVMQSTPNIRIFVISHRLRDVWKVLHSLIPSDEMHDVIWKFGT